MTSRIPDAEQGAISERIGRRIRSEFSLARDKKRVTAFDAKNNWWRCAEGPGHAGCDDLSGVVAFEPWLPRPFEQCGLCRAPAPVGGTTTATNPLSLFAPLAVLILAGAMGRGALIWGRRAADH